MSLDRYQQAWKAESSRTQVVFDAERLATEVRQSHESFRSTILRRDVREIGTSFVMILVWLVLGVALSLPWTWYLTVLSLLWIAGFMLVDRRRHPQHPSAPGEPLLFFAQESLVQVEHQIVLLRNVFWWYLLPPSISIMAFFIHVALDSSNGWWEFVLFSGGFGLVLFVCYAWIYWINQRAIRDQLEPRRDDLRKLVANLESDPNAEESSQMIELVSTLSSTIGNTGLSPNWATWAENWNRIIPSWREVALIIVPTLAGAYAGFRHALPDMGPVFFQSVVAAVIPFEIAFFTLWFLSHRRHRGQPFNGTGRVFLGRPAIATIAMILMISIFAFAAVYACVAEQRSQRGRGLDDLSAFVDQDIVHIDDWLQRMVDSFYPSLSAVIVRDGKVVYQGTFGVEDIPAARPATVQSQYHVASVTKVFTATMAAMLHEQGVVDLDQTVVTYLPKNVRISTTPDHGAAITLRQLASHTSGLPRGVPGQVQSIEGRYDLEPQRLYDLLANVELSTEPGESREYSNLGFGLLGHVLERAAGKPINRLLAEMICEPLQLDNTAIEGDLKLHPATGYARNSRGGAKTTHSLMERLAGSGGLVASAEDLGKFLIAQMEPGVFSSEVLKQLHTETRLADGTGSGTGMGWSLRSNQQVGPILEKNGGRNNCSAWIGFSPDHKVAVAIVANCGGPPVEIIGRELLHHSISPASWRSPTDGGYAKIAPFTGVRWENDVPIVCVHGDWSELASIDGIGVDRIMEFANKQYGKLARKRFAEDLVEVMATMGDPPDWTVTMELKTEAGKLMQIQVVMSKENRDLVRD